MAKKKGYYLNRVGLEVIINNFCAIKSSECLNPTNQQTRYSLEKNGSEFYIDVFFRIDNTITVTPLPKGNSPELATELHGLIRDGVEYKNVVSGTFSTLLPSDKFTELTDYMESLPGLKYTKEDKGQNGLILKYSTDFGDSVTLTYYNSTQKLFYQGLLMNLYVVIKTFLATYTGNVISTKISDSGNESSDDKVTKHINENLPRGFSLLDPLMANFITDSFTLVVASPPLRDYAAWAMPTIRVLEHRIKQLCLDNNVYLSDKQGFKYYVNPGVSNETDYVFNSNHRNTFINTNLQSNFDSDTIDILVRCYHYLKANRHEMFHTTQIVEGTKLVSTPEEAYAIISGSCKLIEESLVLQLGSTA